MNAVKNVLLVLLSVITGVVFLYSAYTKALPIAPFEYRLVEYLHLPWLAAAVLSRLFIGLEAGIGALFLLNIFGSRKWVIRSSFYLLIGFTFYLMYLLFNWGNQVNCGCFGDSIFMSPTASIVKNIILIIIVTILNKWHKGWTPPKERYVTGAILIAGLATPFIMYGLPVMQPDWIKKNGYKLQMAHIYTQGQPMPLPDWQHGKKVMAFMSQGCTHCRNAAYKMHLMNQQDSTLPFILVIALKNDLGNFWKQTGASNIPYMRLPADDFIASTGGVYPMIVFVNNGVVEAKVDFEDMTPGMIRKWLNQPN